MTTSVFLVEDHPLLREILREAIDSVPGLEVCGVAGSAEEMFDRLDDDDPDVALIDMSLPQMNGAQLIAELSARRPALRCLILSGHKEPSYVDRALAAGAWGYVLKGDLREIEVAVAEIIQGNHYVSPALRAQASDDVTPDQA